MDSLDLDINNYSISDLEKFFRLNPKTKYSAADIELKEYQIREQLLNSGHINKRFKRDLITFLETAKTRITMVKANTTTEKYQPTTIPKNYKLDPIDEPYSKETPSRTEELITRPETQFVYSNNSEFFPGKMNPLDSRIITKSLNIDTRFRDNLYSTQSSDFTIQLPNKFSKVVSMQLSSLEFPISFYGISSQLGNNYLYMNVKYTTFDASGSSIPSGVTTTSEQVFIIPDGNYNASDLISTINNLLCPLNLDNTLQHPNSIFSYIQLTLDITSNGSGTGKVTIAPFGAFSTSVLSMVLDFTRDINGIPDKVDVSTKIGWNLGFTKLKYRGQTKYVADTIVEPAAIRYIYLAIDDFNNNTNSQFVNVFQKNLMGNDIFARISLKGSYFSLIMESDYNIVTEPRRYFGPVDIQRLRIRLLDEHGRILPMNSSNYSFCLDLKMLYDL
jgi:hypothetical protein